jgi:hypothetical protein
MTPHKHAELIKAWADGAQIQVRDLTNYVNPDDCKWKDFREFDEEIWDSNWEYRIKPQTITYRVSLHRDPWGGFYTYTWKQPTDLSKSETFIRWLTDWIEVEV